MTMTHTEKWHLSSEHARRDALKAVIRVSHRLFRNDVNEGDLIDHGGDQGGTGFVKFRDAIELIQMFLTEEQYERFCYEVNDGRSMLIPFARYGQTQQKVPKCLEIDCDEFMLTFASILRL